MSTHSNSPILTTNTYGISVKQIVNLYWGEIVRRFVCVVVIFVVLVSSVIFKDIAQPFPSNVFGLVFITGAFLYARFRFISGVEKNPTIGRTTTLDVFQDRFEFMDSDNNYRVYQFADFRKVDLRRIGYVVRMNNNRSILIPTNCFKHEMDRKAFETVLKETITKNW